MEEPPNPVDNLREHPLQNPVVLKITFDLLESSATLKDWKNIRLVCKLWHSETLSRWRSKAVLNLVVERHWSPFFQSQTPSRSQKLSALSLLIFWQNPNDPYKLKQKPYLNYKLEGLTINLPFCDGSLTAASVFWSTVGPWMKTLILNEVNFQNRTELLRFLIDKTPNLEQVTFDSLNWNRIAMGDLSDDRNRLECTSVVSLTCRETSLCPFFYFPNLQKILLEFDDPIEFTNLVFPNFSTVPEHNPLQYSKVTHLDIMNCSVDESVRRQTNIKFPFLEHLSFNLSYPYLSNDQPFSEFGHSMIANHRETLKVLKAFCWIPPRFGDWTIKYPMHVLSKLFLWGNCMDNLDFLRFTPNLTLLHIDLYGLEKKQEMKELLLHGQIEIAERRDYLPERDIVEASRLSGNLAGVVLQKLEYFKLNYKVSSESVRALGEWMPNLKIFKGVLDSSSLPQVCEVWPKLEKLHCLFGSEIKDEDVIGSVEKGVADLKYLTSFHYNSECNKSSLSDKSVRKGFLNMKELTDLQVCVSKNFSRESEDALTNRIQNVSVSRNYNENENHTNWKCCRDMKYMEYISNYQPYNIDIVNVGPPPPVVDLSSSDSDSEDSDISVVEVVLNEPLIEWKF